MQDAATLNVVVFGSLVIIHLLTSKDQPAGPVQTDSSIQSCFKALTPVAAAPAHPKRR
jgi:hypothetical protein